MPPPPAAARRASTRRVAPMFALLVVLLWVTPSSSARESGRLVPAATAANVTLQVIVTGRDGGVSVTGNGVSQVAPDLPDPCDVSWTRDNGRSCIYSVPEGTDVQIERLGAGNLVRWSVGECPGTGRCTVKMGTNRTVVATFTPTRLAVVVEGGDSGVVTSPEANINCSGNGNCATSVPAFAEVTFNATPAGEFEKWSGACQEAGTAPTCTLVLSGDDVVGAKFKNDDDEPNIIPPRQQAELQVVVEPSGAGKVVSSRSRLSEAIDCGSNCKARFEQGERPTLTAQGDRFLEWQGGAPYCTTDPTCRYPAFGITSIKAVWAPALPPQTDPTRCTAKILNVALLRQAGVRSLRVRVLLACRSSAKVRLLRKTSVVVTRSYTLPKGRSALRVGLPRNLRSGWYLITARFVPARGPAVVASRPFRFIR
jgi:hypothetical protein